MKIESYKNWKSGKFDESIIKKNSKKPKKTAVDTSESDIDVKPEPEIFLKPVYDHIHPHLPISIGDGYLKSMTKKDAIKHLQAVLNIGMESGLKVDGNFGPVTHSALSDWNPSKDSNEIGSDCIIAVLNQAQKSGIDSDYMMQLIAGMLSAH